MESSEVNTSQEVVDNTKVVKRKTFVGPWKNVAEFNQVYNWLFDENAGITETTNLQRALSQMRVWSVRRSTLCPAAVLATMVIVQVQLKDEANNSNDKKLSCDELQSLYSSAFTRFFNYMSSIMQAHNLRTMYDTARELGLASFVVDLRHICAHGQTLPPLEVLQNTAKYCLLWLKDYYWELQRVSMRDVDASRIRRKDKTDFDDNVTHFFSIYDAALECYLKGAHNMKTSKRHVHGKRFTNLKEYYASKNLKSLVEVFEGIVNDLSALVKREISIKDISEICIEALLKMKYFFNAAETHGIGEGLETLINVTQGLFRMLATFGFIEELFHALIQIAENPIKNACRRAGASFWATQIAAAFVAFRKCKKLYREQKDAHPDAKEVDFSKINSGNMPKKVRKYLISANVDMKRTLLIGESLRRPWVWTFDRDFFASRLQSINEYTISVIKTVMPLIEPALSNNDMKTFEELIDALFGGINRAQLNATKSKSADAATIYTVNDLLKQLPAGSKHTMDLDDVEMDDIPSKPKKYGIWTQVPDDDPHDWASCPLGRLPWE